MRESTDGLLLSASDLVNFLGCEHATYLDLQQLRDPIEVPPPDEQMVLLQEKGIEHERAHLDRLKAEGRSVVEIDGNLPLAERVTLTTEAMTGGPDVIYQGALLGAPWHGYSDFLIRIDEPSKIGAWSYEVADTKLSRSAKPKHIVQLCVYSDLVGREQSQMPRRMHVVLGDTTTVSLNVSDFYHYFRVARARFEAFLETPPTTSAGEPCSHCTLCRWSEICEAEWERTDHLSLVANITKVQRRKLMDSGIETMAALATLPLTTKILNLHADTLAKLRSQAALQVAKRTDGGNRHEVLPRAPGKGFNRLPEPSAGDLFFDMEGDPLYGDGGLEYLFGFAHEEAGGAVEFTAFWAHDRAEEKLAFERAVDFIVERLRRYPDAHVYHYAHYEETAFKRLAMYHGTRETAIDDLLRQRKLVDLYRVVREGIRVSEPSYSIKNLEAFYLPEKRSGEVTSAGDSIVIYERWRRLRQPGLLNEIERYNETDCRSTRMCRDWLLSLRPADATWYAGPTVEPEDPKEKEREEKRIDAERRTAEAITALTRGVPEEERPWRELVAHLLEFHRREAKPSWWAMFTRLEMSEEELVDDAECIGGLSRDAARPVEQAKRSTVHHFRFPPQDFKMRVGDVPLRADTGKPAGELVAVDDVTNTISLKIGPNKELSDKLSLIPQGPIGDAVLRAALYRYAAAVIEAAGAYPAVTAVLRKELPRVAGLAPGAPIVPEEGDQLAGAIDALERMQSSCMLIQGPPGTGKTYTSSHAIVELLQRGYRVGVSSLSHKAINNLLAGIEKVANDRGVTFSGIKKSSSEDQLFRGKLIEDTGSNETACEDWYQLVAGTAWLFAREDLDQKLDYLFVDEAGQVSLANVVAMGLCAKNIVLIGDQMQLSQPIQGVHPGSSGLSALEYLLGDFATVPADRGIFLATTHRMNPDICGFISDAVYDGRLKTAPGNERQRLVLDTEVAAGLAPTGLRFVAVQHNGNAQKSVEEAARLADVYQRLLGQRWIDRSGNAHPIGTDDILVVSPYNMQVNMLRSILPAGARVGTVDKFQGQEAAVVLISMATSSGDDLPRHIEFLFSRNRLNVAISRARCLAVILASPRLLDVPCSRIEQMELVNTLCWAKTYGEEQSRIGAGARWG